MWLERYGWNEYWRRQAETAGAALERLGRVLTADGAGWLVRVEAGEKAAVYRGDPATPPAVGDWAVWEAVPGDPNRIAIKGLLPRRGALARKAAGRASREQVMAANVDWLLIVSSLNRDFNPSRLERYAAMAWQGGASPVVVLSKADLCDDPVEAALQAETAVPGATVISVSATTGAGLEALAPFLGPGATVALVGSSGVGKSTLVNALLGETRLATGAIREADAKGRHTTVRRELLPLPSGGVIIDTPGMRELGLWADEAALARTFDDIEALAADCRFRDCRHEREPGCAVRAAVDRGELDARRLENRHKLTREIERLDLRLDPLANQKRKSRDKALAKTIRRLQKGKRG